MGKLAQDKMKGFTLVELLVVMGVAAILLGLTTINLVRVQQTTNLGAVTDTLISDIKSQQIKAMNGAAGGGSFGIHFTSLNSYVLFKGSLYTAADPANFSVDLDTTISVSSAPDNDIIFSPTTGDIASLHENTVTIKHTAGGEQQTLKLNKLGVITDVN